ncbi:hypothetical protein A9498_29355 (plasmid) [Bacillus thuringiensis serovar coreanensis]|nr:hypothetical protein A9498_29355 [Bacillus thuringiensis serovar coreanensis]
MDYQIRTLSNDTIVQEGRLEQQRPLGWKLFRQIPGAEFTSQITFPIFLYTLRLTCKSIYGYWLRTKRND